MDRTDAATRKIENVIGRLPGRGKLLHSGRPRHRHRRPPIRTSRPSSRTLKPWDERKCQGPAIAADPGARPGGFAKVPEAFTFAFGLPPILGLSTTGGFQFMLEDRAGRRRANRWRADRRSLVDAARRRPELANVLSTFRANVPAYKVNMDLAKVQTLGIPVADAYNALQTFLGGLYVNDFNVFGRTWQVLVQAEPEFRTGPPTSTATTCARGGGDMVPLGTFATVSPTTGPDVIYRYNRFRAIQILGGPAPGYSSGEASRPWRKSPPAPARRIRLRVDRHHLPAKAGAGPRRHDLRLRLGAGVSLSGGALRELVDSAGGAAGAAAGHVRRAAGRVSARLSVRHLHADRHRDADRAGRQERHSDRRVRAREPRGRGCPSARRRSKPRACGCAPF